MDISIHALLAESDASQNGPLLGIYHFYPRSPCGERPRGGVQLSLNTQHFYPRSPCGERLWVLTGGSNCNGNFYPRSPCGERHRRSDRLLPTSDFYPRSPCGERRVLCYLDNIEITISIHALLAESDSHLSKYNTSQKVFLSTLSLRRATVSDQHLSSDFWNFYPRSPCGERLRC